MMDALVNKFNQQALKHQESQTLNPFSDRFNRSPSPRPKFSKEEYGKPVAGSKTDIRGQKAFSHINREILELCECIHDIGIHRRDPDDGSPQVLVPFGELFAVYSRISDKVSGLLIAAKKRGYVYFEPEILFQRRDDDEIVALVMSMAEIKAHVKGQTGGTPSPSAATSASSPANSLEAKPSAATRSSSPANSLEAKPSAATSSSSPANSLEEKPSAATSSSSPANILEAKPSPSAATSSSPPANILEAKPSSSAATRSSSPANSLEAKDVSKRKSKSPSPAPSKAIPTTIEPTKDMDEKTETSIPAVISVEASPSDNQTNENVAEAIKFTEESTPSVSAGAPGGSDAPVDKSLNDGIVESKRALENVIVTPTSSENMESVTPAEDTCSAKTVEEVAVIPVEEVATITVTPLEEVVRVEDISPTVAVTPIENICPASVIESETPSGPVQSTENSSSVELPVDTASSLASSEENPTEDIKSTPVAEAQPIEESTSLAKPLQDIDPASSAEEVTSDDALTLVMYVPVEETPITAEETLLSSKPLELSLTPSADAPSSDKGEQTLA